MVYYNKLYWLIEFSNDLFTVLESDGSDIQSNDNLIEMVKDFANGKFTNVIQEKEKNDIIELYEKFILLILMETNEQITKTTLTSKFIEHLKNSNIEYHQNHFQVSLKNIIKQDFFLKDSDKFSLSLDSIDKKLQFYKYLLNNQILLKSLNTDLYQKYIDYDLVDAIINIQYNIKLSNEEKRKLLNFIKMSPSSLISVLHEIDLIVNHRKDPANLHDNVDVNDTNILFMLLHQHLEKDFYNKSFKDFYYIHNNIKELEVKHMIKLKNKKEIVLENTNIKRLGIGQMSDEYNNQLVQILMIDNAPEPWEEINKNEETNNLP